MPGVVYRVEFDKVRAGARSLGRDPDPEMSARIAPDRSPDTHSVGNLRRRERVRARCVKRIRWRKPKYAARKHFVIQGRRTNTLSAESVGPDEHDSREGEDQRARRGPLCSF